MDVAHPDDGYALAPGLRECDREELLHVWGRNSDVGQALATSIEVSDEAFIIYDHQGVIHGVWGHGHWDSGPVSRGLGYVWLLGSDALFRDHGYTMTSVARREIFPVLDSLYPVYGNWTMSSNLVHCRWLLRSGFKRVTNTDFNGKAFSLYLRNN